LLHLAIGSPTEIAGASVLHIGVRDIFETTRRVEPRRNFIRQRFVLDEAVIASRVNGLLV